ncbi:MAG TPA: branched-chain amino acid ABC transporter permease [Candidatus Kapabacteria bacterium]|jgi:branched-chain amino acid transport system permease protein|nr:branched-chain amino acid ABC transporter permease [Candidatus Kapabacteria bacterium]
MKSVLAHLSLLGAILLSFVASYFSEHLDPYFLRVIVTVGINITLAVSLNLVNGYTGQFSLGHAGFMCVGAYTSAVLTMFVAPRIFGKILPVGEFSSSLFFLIAILISGFTAALSGLIVGIPSLRLKGDYLAIVTLGFGEIIRIIFLNITAVGAARGLPGIPTYTNLFWAYAFAFITIYVVLSIIHSSYGRGFIAVHDDEIAAEAMGINTTRYKITAFAVSAFFAGIAGGLYAHYKTFISPNGFDFMRSIEIVVMVILGGMGNTIGVIAAAILLTILPEVLRPIEDYRMIIYSFLLIVLMLTRPQGLFRIKFRPRIKPASDPTHS